MSTSDPFGPLTGPDDIRAAVIAQLNEPMAAGGPPALVYWLADLERQKSLAPHTLKLPPGPRSWIPEVEDFERYQSEWMPMIGVAVEPADNAERYSAGYVQKFTITIRVFVQDDDDLLARKYADIYGLAVAGNMMIDTSLGGVAMNLQVTRGPLPALLGENAQVATSTVELEGQFLTVTEAVVPSWPVDPYDDPIPSWPTVETVNPSITASPDDVALGVDPED